MRRLLPVAFAALAAFACSTTNTTDPASNEDDGPRTRYSSEAGGTPVGVIPIATLRDASRGKDLEMTIDYPTRGGPHPLIVFSHGSAAGISSGRAYVGLSSHWASYGYVVIKPTHSDTARAEDRRTSDWRARVDDIRFVLDNIAALEQKYPELQGKIDQTKIGAGGQDLGAVTALLLAGARTFPGPTSYADPRVKAVVAMSPIGTTEALGLTRESWSEVRTPVLFMTGDRDAGAGDTETAEWRREVFELAAPGDKWLMFFEGAGHLAFAGRTGLTAAEMNRPTHSAIDDRNRDPLSEDRRDPTRGPRPGGGYMDRTRAVFNTVKGMTVAFWDAYLRADAEGRAQLDRATDRSGLELKKK